MKTKEFFPDSTDVACPVCGDFLYSGSLGFRCPICETYFKDDDLKDFLSFIDEDDFLDYNPREEL